VEKRIAETNLASTNVHVVDEVIAVAPVGFTEHGEDFRLIEPGWQVMVQKVAPHLAAVT